MSERRYEATVEWWAEGDAISWTDSDGESVVVGLAANANDAQDIAAARNADLDTERARVAVLAEALRRLHETVWDVERGDHRPGDHFDECETCAVLHGSGPSPIRAPSSLTTE